MAQQEIFYRPPSEAESFIIRVVYGCPHNKCTFCNLFKQTHFRPVPLQEVLEGLDRDADALGPRFIPLVKSIYLEGGDPLILRTSRLLRIMEHARRRFPHVERFACYTTARFTTRKRQEDLDALARAGLRRVFVGLESGCDSILERTCKGCTTADLLRTGEMLEQAGIEMDVSLMLGIGGRELSRRHAVETAYLLNALNPACARIRTFVPKEGTPLGDAWMQGRFQLLTPHEILHELRLMSEHLVGSMQLLSEHWSDFIHFDARLPEARDALLAYIDQHLALPPDAFRRPDIGTRQG